MGVAGRGGAGRRGVDGIILENFGSAPFPTGGPGDRTPPHQVAIMGALAARIVREYGAEVRVGVNCLRNDALAAIGIAAAAGADFVRVNVHAGAMLTDQGVIQGEAHRTLRYRMSVDAQRVAILADVLVKHAQPLAAQPMEDAVRECTERALADGVIVSGSGTGEPVDPDALALARRACDGHPLLIGSGLTPRSAPQLAPLADGAIVGTWLKQGGDVRAPVDGERVRQMAGALGDAWAEARG